MNEITDVNSLIGPLPSASADLLVEGLIGMMQKHLIGRACTLSTVGILLDANVGNAMTRAVCAEHSELLPVATLNPLHYYGDPLSVTRLNGDGFKMMRFFPAMQGWPIDFAPFRELTIVLSEMRLPLMVDIELHGDITRLQSVLGSFPAPVVLAGVRLEQLAEAAAVLRDRPDWNIETSLMLAPGGLQAAANLIGTDRILFGSRQPALPAAAVLKTLEFSGLHDNDVEKILHKNAERLLQ